MTYFSPATAFTAEFVFKIHCRILRLYAWLVHGSLGHTLQASARWFCKNLHKLMNLSLIKPIIAFSEKLWCYFLIQLPEITVEEALGNWKGKYIQDRNAHSFWIHLLLTLSIVPTGFWVGFGNITCWEISLESIEFQTIKNTHKAIAISIRHTSDGSKLGQSLEFPMVRHAYHVKYQEKLIQKSEDLGFSPGFVICWRKKNQVSFLRSYFLLCKWGIDPYSAYMLGSMRVKLNHIHRFRERQLTTSQTVRLWVSRY